MLVPLGSFGQSISGSTSIVQGQAATYSLNVGGGCNSGNYDDVSWSTSATLLECVSYATTACMEINVRFDNAGSQTIVVSYSCEGGGSGWASLTVNVTPCPPGNPTVTFAPNPQWQIVHTFISVSGLSPCRSYRITVSYTDGRAPDEYMVTGVTSITILALSYTPSVTIN